MVRRSPYICAIDSSKSLVNFRRVTAMNQPEFRLRSNNWISAAGCTPLVYDNFSQLLLDHDIVDRMDIDPDSWLLAQSI